MNDKKGGKLFLRGYLRDRYERENGEKNETAMNCKIKTHFRIVEKGKI